MVLSLFITLLPEVVEQDLHFSHNMPPALRREILRDFGFLDSIRGSQSTPLHQKIFGDGPLDGRRYTQFLRTYIQSFSFTTSDSPYQIQTDGDRNLYIFASYLPFARAVSTFSRAINFMHEAYHNSGSHHHTKCPTPFLDEKGRDLVTNVGGTPLAGLYACDDNYQGSYAVEIIIAKNIERYCENCSPSLRREAALYADDLMKRIIGTDVRRMMIEDLYQETPPFKVGDLSGKPVEEPKQGFL